MPGWFDLYDWPIGIKAKRDPLGLERSVQSIETYVDELMSEKGIDRDRIVIGGFSQGGAIAMQTVYSNQKSGSTSSSTAGSSGEGNENEAYKSYAACVSLSGWVNFDSVEETSKGTPLFWGHGKWDDKVLFEQQEVGVTRLVEEFGVTHVESESYPMAHSSHPEELKAFASFLDKILYKE